MDWAAYYAAVSGRQPRPLFRRALEERGDSPPGAAVDLGSGDGTETLALLGEGWRVRSIDAAPASAELILDRVSDEHRPKLAVQTSSFEEADMGEADLVYAGLSLPFLDASTFPLAWERIRAALRPGAILAAHLFGPNDTWAAEPGMTFHDRAAVEALLDGLEILALDEIDEDGAATSGPKHWHVFEVVARQPTG
ncbi:MAG: class I SAM-dependent methyltransferase [Chloroflexota bacterium]